MLVHVDQNAVFGELVHVDQLEENDAPFAGIARPILSGRMSSHLDRIGGTSSDRIGGRVERFKHRIRRRSAPPSAGGRAGRRDGRHPPDLPPPTTGREVWRMAPYRLKEKADGGAGNDKK